MPTSTTRLGPTAEPCNDEDALRDGLDLPGQPQLLWAVAVLLQNCASSVQCSSLPGFLLHPEASRDSA